MKLTFSAETFSAAMQKKPSLSGASSLIRITIRPARISSSPSSILEIGINQNWPVKLAAVHANLSALCEKAMNVFTNQISFDVDFITNPAALQISVLQSKWDDRHGKTFTVTIVDRQADPIQRHRPFGNH